MKRLGLLVFLFACGEKSIGDTGSDLDTERAADLWQAIDGYESWGTVEGWEGLVESVDLIHEQHRSQALGETGSRKVYGLSYFFDTGQYG